MTETNTFELGQDDVDPQEEADERWARETPEEAGVASAVDYDRVKKWVIKRDGKDYVQYVGLLDLLHQVSGGRFRIDTKLVQAPNAGNGMLAIASAEVHILADDDDGTGLAGPVRTASGLGDASAESVNRMMAPHLVRMAETRAKGRALRDLLNIGLVTIEELGPGGPAPSGNGRPGGYQQEQGRPPEGIVVAGQRYTRDQVWEAYTKRMHQMREARLPIPDGAALGNAAPCRRWWGPPRT